MSGGPWEDYRHPQADTSGPWEDYRQPASKDEEVSTGAAQAALEGFGNQVAMGHLPHVQAYASGALQGAERLLGFGGGGVDKELESQGFNIVPKNKGYVAERDSNIKRLDQEFAEHPAAYGAGAIGGALAGGAAMAGVLPAVQGATFASRAGQAAKAGAAMGALQNPGDVEGEFGGLQAGDRIHNAGIGAASGAVLQGGIEGLGKVGGSLSTWYGNKASEKAAKVLGRGSEFKNLTPEKRRELGRMLLDEGHVTPLTSTQTLSDRVAKLKQSAGENIESLIDKAGTEPTIDLEKIAMDLATDSKLDSMRRIPGQEHIPDKTLDSLQTLANSKQVSPGRAREIRQGIDQSIRDFNQSGGTPGMQNVYKDQRFAIGDALNEAVPGLKDANKRFSLLATAGDISDQQIKQDAANRAIGATEFGAGAIGGLLGGGPVGALAAAAANKAARTYGNATMARGFDVASRGLSQLPKFADLAAKDPQGLARLASRIGTRIDGAGEFQKAAPVQQDFYRLIQEKPELIDRIKDPQLKAQLQKQFGRNPAASESPAPDQLQPAPLKDAQQKWQRGG